MPQPARAGRSGGRQPCGLPRRQARGVADGLPDPVPACREELAVIGGLQHGPARLRRRGEPVPAVIPRDQELPPPARRSAARTSIRHITAVAPARRWRNSSRCSPPGPDPAGFADQPAPNPADFGWPARDDGSRNDPLVGQNIMSCHRYQHDSGALRAASTRVVIAVAAESSTMTAGRAAVAVAGRLGTTPATFPGGHDGSPAANTAGRAIRTPPPPPCARPSPADSLPPPRRSPAPSARSSRTAAGEGQDTAKCANRPDRTTSATGVSGFRLSGGVRAQCVIGHRDGPGRAVPICAA